MTLEDIIAERDICRQLTNFARAMDSRDWQAIRSIVADDIKAELGMGVIQGSTAVIEFMRSFLDNCGTTQHMLGNIIVHVTGDKAISQSYVSDMHLSKNTESDMSFRTLGDYSDTWEKTDGKWLMVQRVKNNRATIGSLDVFKP